MTYSTISERGQTTIPSEIRAALQLKPGDKVTYTLKNDSVTVKRHPGVGSVAGILKGKGRSPVVPFREERKQARKKIVKQAST